MSPGRRLIPEIDGLRFVAITLVFLFHSRNWVRQTVGVTVADESHAYRFLHHGDYGVQLFFVISGFLLALPFARRWLRGGRKVLLADYFKRRLTRLEPPYVLAMIGLFVAGILVGRPRAAEMWPNLLAGLLYQHNLIFGSMNHINGVAWSLEVEVQFYVLTPALTYLFAIGPRDLRRATLVALILCFGVVAQALEASSPRWGLSVLGHLHEFFAGYLLADVFVLDWKEAPQAEARWDIVTILVWPAIFAIRMNSAWLSTVLPLLVVVAYAAALRGPWTRAVLSSPWIVSIGGMCYTIYLLHQPIIQQVGALVGPRAPMLPPGLSLLAWSALFGVASLVVSVAFFLVIERPCMNPSWPSVVMEAASRKTRGFQ